MATSLNQPQAISQPFAQNGDKNVIPVTNDGTTGAASESLGFPSVTSVPVAQGGIPPARKDFNGIFNVLSNQYFYLQNGGSFTFNQDVSDAIGGYPVNAILRYTDNDVSYQVRSLIPNNTYNFVTTPSYIDGVHWEKAFSEDLSNYVSKTGSNTISANNTFSGTNTFSGSTSLSTNTTGVTQATNDASTKIATTQFVQNVAVTKANKDMDNLTSTGQNIANWSSNVTNCITEIPQDIKLELNNGELYLLSGSKVYIPNGSGTFDEVVTSTNLRNKDTTKNGQWLLALSNSGVLAWGNLSTSTSGAGVTPASGMAFAFDTTANTIKRYGDTTTLYSLPIAICTLQSGTGIISIDQVFNGFGYIGSTVFVLPGVKGLIPSGRNDDGTLKNIEISFSKVVTQINNVAYSGDVAIASDYFDLAQGDLYNETDNRNYLSDGVTPFNRCIAGKFVKGTNGIVTSLTLKTAFHAVDYNDFSDLKDTVDNDVVKLTGNQTINGVKTFNSSTMILQTSNNITSALKILNADKGTTPSVNLYSKFRIVDKNGTADANTLAAFEGGYLTSGYTCALLQAYNPTSNTRAQIGVYYNGTDYYTYAPTPSVSSNDTKIATTAYVNNKHQLVSALPASPNADIFYYIPEN